MRFHRQRRDESGATLVEFAIVLPILALLVFGIIEFGFVFNDYLELRSGSREAGRIGAVDNGCFSASAGCPGSADTQRDNLIDAARLRLSGLADPSTVAVGLYLPNGGQVGKDVVVCMNFTVNSRTKLLSPFVDNIKLKSLARFRLEQAATFAAGTDWTVSQAVATKGGSDPAGAPTC